VGRLNPRFERRCCLSRSAELEISPKTQEKPDRQDQVKDEDDKENPEDDT